MFRYFVTGSQAFGVIHSNSDIDIVVKKEDAEDLKFWLSEKGIEYYQTEDQAIYEENTGSAGFYFDFHFISINIIVTDTEEEFQMWLKNTQRMLKRDPIDNKEERKAIFNDIDAVSF